jgi:hypothetical protein
MWSLSACAERVDWTQPAEDPFLISNNIFFGSAVVDTGPYVFIGRPGHLYYLDKETERITFNCIEPACGHFSVDGDTCTGSTWLAMGPLYPGERSVYGIFQNMPDTIQEYGQYRRDFYPLGIKLPKNYFYFIYKDCLVVYSSDENQKENSGVFSFYDLETYALRTTLIAEGSGLLDWFVYDEVLYYIDMALDLYKLPITDGEAVLLDTKVEHLAIDEDNLYYIKKSKPSGLYRLGLKGGAPSLLIENAGAFGVGTEYIYYTRFGDTTGRAFVSDKEGNEKTMFLEDLVYPYFYAFSDYNKIIVRDGKHDGIFLADLDGSNVKYIPLPIVEEWE